MLFVLEQSFLNYFMQKSSSKDSLIFKQMYETTGLAFAFIYSQN